MHNIIKEKIETGGKALGTFFELGSTFAAECLGRTGFDYIIIDSEHGPFDPESTTDFIRAAENSGITPFVRVSDISRQAVLKMLDVGAKGLIIPCVESTEQVRQLVRYAKFYPLGQRGFSPCRSSGWGFDPHAASINSYMCTCNEETLLLPQCETKEALDKIEEIAAIDGVDGIFVGPFDLSISLGKPAQFDDPVIKNAISRILEACKKANKMAFIFTNDIHMVQNYFAQGFDSVTYCLDATIFINACRAVVEQANKNE